MEPTPEAGWTIHNTEVLRQYSAYLEQEILGGGMVREEVDEYLDEIKQTVEANNGEARREAAEEAAATEAKRNAISYKTALVQQGAVGVLNVGGKGKGRTNTSFPTLHAPHRCNAMAPQPAKATESANAVNALLTQGRNSSEQA